MVVRRVIKTGLDARVELAKGAKYLADAVGPTYGPFGHNFFLEKSQRPTNDGAKIAAEIQLTSAVIMPDGQPANEINNLGVIALREATNKANDEAGDGSTSATILAHEIYNAASRYLSKEGVIGKMPPAQLVKQIETERVEITQKIKDMATPIVSKEDLVKSAIVATEDAELGKLIGEAQWELGPDGYLLAEETAERTSSVERVKGVRIDNGFGTSQIINNQEKQALEVENTKVILTSYTIKTMADWDKLKRVCEAIGKSGFNTVTIIARAWTDETVNYCLQNIQKGFNIYPLSAPYTDMQERMKDLQAVVGGTFYDSENSSLEDMQLSDVGFASKIVARRFDAIITGKDDERTNERMQKRIDEILAKKAGSQSEFEKKTLDERAAQLTNGFSIIKVGSPSDMERKRLYDKAEDAVNAVRSALQEGTVPGAGLAFKQIADTLPDTYILKRPLQVLNEQIMASAPEGFVVEDWVRDPAKVLRIALERACAVAGSFATAGGAVATEHPKSVDQLVHKLTGQQ